MKKIEWKNITLTDVKGVFLDLDDTLYRYSTCHEYALRKSFDYLADVLILEKKELTAEYNLCRKRIHVDLIGTGASHSRLLYFQKLVEKFAQKTDTKLILKLEQLYWLEFFSKMEIFPEALSFLKKCKRNKIPILIITDLTAQIQFQKINHLKIQNFIQWVVSSEEAGIEKPHPYIFYLALEKLKLKKSEVIMIGDNEKKDILGANLLSIKSYWV